MALQPEGNDNLRRKVFLHSLRRQLLIHSSQLMWGVWAFCFLDEINRLDRTLVFGAERRVRWGFYLFIFQSTVKSEFCLLLQNVNVQNDSTALWGKSQTRHILDNIFFFSLRAWSSWSIKSMFKETKHRRENNSQGPRVISNRAWTRPRDSSLS